MTQRPFWLRTAHRAHAGLTLLVVLVLMILRLTGVLGTGQAVALFLVLEVPLLLLFIVLSVLRFRRTAHVVDAGFLDRLKAEEPLLRPVVSELRTFQSLGLLLVGKRRVPAGARPFGYTKGAMTLPAVMIALSLAELVIVHILVPWPWLRMVLLILTIWGVLLILGFFAARIVHPHYLTDETLHLRWGHQAVLATALANVVTAAPHANHAHTQPHVEGGRLILTQFQGTNVLLRFAVPVETAAPVAKKHLPSNFHASEVQLYVDDPEALLHALTPFATEMRS